MAITATVLGNIPANTGVYKSAEVDTLLSALDEKFEGKLVNAIHWKGTVATVEALPTDAEAGDMYNVGADLSGDNYVWNGSAWDKMASSFGLPDYLLESALESKYLQIANVDSKVTELGYAKTADVNEALAEKQDNLSTEQLAACDSGITSAKVSAYDAHVANADIHVTAAQKTAWTAKQDALDDTQMAAVNSGITATKVAAYDAYATGKQDTLDTAQLAAVNSGITAAKVGTYDGYAAQIDAKQDAASLDTDVAALTYVKAAVTDALDGRLDAIAGVTVPAKDTVTIYALWEVVNAIVAAAEA